MLKIQPFCILFKSRHSVNSTLKGILSGSTKAASDVLRIQDEACIVNLLTESHFLCYSC